MYRRLKLTCEGGLARVTLDRAERHNAFCAELMREMIAAGADLKDSTRWAGGAPLQAAEALAI